MKKFLYTLFLILGCPLLAQAGPHTYTVFLKSALDEPKDHTLELHLKEPSSDHAIQSHTFSSLPEAGDERKIVIHLSQPLEGPDVEVMLSYKDVPLETRFVAGVGGKIDILVTRERRLILSKDKPMDSAPENESQDNSLPSQKA